MLIASHEIVTSPQMRKKNGSFSKLSNKMPSGLCQFCLIRELNSSKVNLVELVIFEFDTLINYMVHCQLYFNAKFSDWVNSIFRLKLNHYTHYTNFLWITTSTPKMAGCEKCVRVGEYKKACSLVQCIEQQTVKKKKIQAS